MILHSTKRLDKDEFVQRSKKVHGEKFDYSKVEYKNNREKVCITCPIHGDFWQIPNSHMLGKGCWECRNVTIGNKKRDRLNDFLRKAALIHGDKYVYDKVVYSNTYKEVDIICPTHGVFSQKPNNHLSGYGCVECGKNTGFDKKGIKNVCKHPLYNTWTKVKARCRCPKDKSYSRYGAKGINVSDEFYNSFYVFMEYLMGLDNYDKKLSDGWSLDRINPKGNYERGNLRWADNFTQARNKNVFAKSGYEGIRIVNGKIYVTVSVALGFADTIEEGVAMRNAYIEEHDLPCRIQ